MKLKFTKMHGCGNDYIYVNCFEQEVSDFSGISERLSHRRFGVGGDGVIYICPSDVADAKMRMFNADGSEGKMCGNGIRCVGKYLFDNNMVQGDSVSIETLSGIKKLQAYRNEHGEVTSLKVDMGKAEFAPNKIPVALDGDSIIGKSQKIGEKTYNITCVSMGNPHCIVFESDVEGLDLEKIGPLFEHNAIFPEGVNTEFIRVNNDRDITMRVWERGSGETWACGTGACACVAAAVKNGFCKEGEDITVHLIGGDLVINYTDDTVMMTGPATKVFDGEVEI